MPEQKIKVYCQCGMVYERDRAADLSDDVTGIGMSCCDNCPPGRFEYIDDFYEYYLYDNDKNEGWN